MKRPLREKFSPNDRAKDLSSDGGLNKRVKTAYNVGEDLSRRWILPKPTELKSIPKCVQLADDNVLLDCLGFSSFSTSKGLHVFGNQDGHLPPRRKRRQYRQMLHVKGIYDIPLTRDQLSNKQI